MFVNEGLLVDHEYISELHPMSANDSAKKSEDKLDRLKMHKGRINKYYDNYLRSRTVAWSPACFEKNEVLLACVTNRSTICLMRTRTNRHMEMDMVLDLTPILFKHVQQWVLQHTSPQHRPMLKRSRSTNSTATTCTTTGSDAVSSASNKNKHQRKRLRRNPPTDNNTDGSNRGEKEGNKKNYGGTNDDDSGDDDSDDDDDDDDEEYEDKWLGVASRLHVDHLVWCPLDRVRLLCVAGRSTAHVLSVGESCQEATILCTLETPVQNQDPADSHQSTVVKDGAWITSVAWCGETQLAVGTSSGSVLVWSIGQNESWGVLSKKSIVFALQGADPLLSSCINCLQWSTIVSALGIARGTEVHVWEPTSSTITSASNGDVKSKVTELQWCCPTKGSNLSESTALLQTLVGVEERPLAYGHRWTYARNISSSSPSSSSSSSSSSCTTTTTHVLSDHTPFLLEPNVKDMMYDGIRSVLATNSTHRKIVGSGSSKHGLVLAVAGIRRNEGNEGTKSARYDTLAKTGSMTSVVYANVLVSNDEFLQFIQSWLTSSGEDDISKEGSRSTILDVWDISTAVITHMSQGVNQAERHDDKVAASHKDESKNHKALLQLILNVLKEHGSQRARHLGMYLKRHAWGFGCLNHQQVRTEDELTTMVSNLRNDEQVSRTHWISDAIQMFVLAYCVDGASMEPSVEEQVSS